MGLPAAGRGDDVSESRGSGDVRTPLPEYHSTVYLELSNTGAMSGGGVADGGKGDPMVVGYGRTYLQTGGL